MTNVNKGKSMTDVNELPLSDLTVAELNSQMRGTMSCEAIVYEQSAAAMSAKIGKVIDLLKAARKRYARAPGIHDTDKLWDCLDIADAELKEAVHLLTLDRT